MKNTRLRLIALVTVTALVTTGLLTRGSASPTAQDGLPDLAAGLRAIEGCLGVETAQTGSGKNVIFAWFEDKKAAKRWYYSEMHQGVMQVMFEDRTKREPMGSVPEEVGPILAIASITFSEKPEIDGVPMPISQIAIELYTPITGGIQIGGRFAPDTLVVPKRKLIAVEDEE